MGRRSPRYGNAIAPAPMPIARRSAVEPALEEYRWLLEELKVSLFAQELRTAQPVSYKRLEKAWAELSRG